MFNQFAKEINATIINLSSPQCLESAWKTFPLLFHGAFAPSFFWCRRPWGYCGM